MEKQKYKYIISICIVCNDNFKNLNEYEDYLGVYDSLSEAQEGIRNVWKLQSNELKNSWEENNIFYEEFNFTFDTINNKLKGNEIAEDLKNKEAIVYFKKDDKVIFEWVFSIRPIPYKPF